MSNGFSINGAILGLQRNLRSRSDQVSRTFERLGTGQRINHASDDAASLAVSANLQLNSRVFGQGIRNLNDGISALNIADSSLSDLGSIVQRQVELATQAASGSYSTKQRTSLNNEAQRLRDEFNRLVEQTSFNGTKLLDGSTRQLALQGGFGSNGAYLLSLLSGTEGSGSSITGTGTYSTGTVEDFVGNNGLGKLDINSANIQGLTADLNGDGRDDLILAGEGLTGLGINDRGLYVNIYLADSSGNLNLTNEYAIFIYDSTNVTSIDFQIGLGDENSDGKLDIALLCNLNTSMGTVSQDALLTGFGDGSFSVANNVGPGIAVTDHTLGIVFGDFNGDGVQDKVDRSGHAPILLIQNTTTQSSSSTAESLLQDAFSLISEASARSALTALQTQLGSLGTKRGQLGSYMNRLQVGVQTLASRRDALEGARARLTNIDVAEESAQLVKLQILQKVGAAILGQATQQGALLLDLLK